ncbi:hypothetical protein PCE1_000897 [Barthelona sp. PCE]
MQALVEWDGHMFRGTTVWRAHENKDLFGFFEFLNGCIYYRIFSIHKKFECVNVGHVKVKDVDTSKITGLCDFIDFKRVVFSLGFTSKYVCDLESGKSTPFTLDPCNVRGCWFEKILPNSVIISQPYLEATVTVDVGPIDTHRSRIMIAEVLNCSGFCLYQYSYGKGLFLSLILCVGGEQYDLLELMPPVAKLEDKWYLQGVYLVKLHSDEIEIWFECPGYFVVCSLLGDKFSYKRISTGFGISICWQHEEFEFPFTAEVSPVIVDAYGSHTQLRINPFSLISENLVLSSHRFRNFVKGVYFLRDSVVTRKVVYDLSQAFSTFGYKVYPRAEYMDYDHIRVSVGCKEGRVFGRVDCATAELTWALTVKHGYLGVFLEDTRCCIATDEGIYISNGDDSTLIHEYQAQFYNPSIMKVIALTQILIATRDFVFYVYDLDTNLWLHFDGKSVYDERYYHMYPMNMAGYILGIPYGEGEHPMFIIRYDLYNKVVEYAWRDMPCEFDENEHKYVVMISQTHVYHRGRVYNIDFTDKEIRFVNSDSNLRKSHDYAVISRHIDECRLLNYSKIPMTVTHVMYDEETEMISYSESITDFPDPLSLERIQVR